jgi:hypothetical protein
MENKSRGMTTQGKVIMGAGIAALAAGAVFLYGTEAGKKSRKNIQSWALRMRADVMDRMEGMKEWSEESYYGIIDTVAKKYKGIKNLDPVEVAALVRDLKAHWNTISRQVQGGQKKRKPARRTARKTKATA